MNKRQLDCSYTRTHTQLSVPLEEAWAISTFIFSVWDSTDKAPSPQPPPPQHSHSSSHTSTHAANHLRLSDADVTALCFNSGPNSRAGSEGGTASYSKGSCWKGAPNSWRRALVGLSGVSPCAVVHKTLVSFCAETYACNSWQGAQSCLLLSHIKHALDVTMKNCVSCLQKPVSFYENKNEQTEHRVSHEHTNQQM